MMVSYNCCASVSEKHNVGLDTADTKSFVYSDPYVALFTPGGAPGVLDQPVVFASVFVSAIANYEHGMVNFVDVAAIFVGINDTARVVLNEIVTRRNSYGKRHTLKCQLHLAYIHV